MEMELDDCAGAGFDDSDVYLEGGISGIGPVNSLMPRFEQDERLNEERSRSGKRENSSKKAP